MCDGAHAVHEDVAVESKHDSQSESEDEPVSKDTPKKKVVNEPVDSFYRIDDDPQQRIISKTKEVFNNFLSDEEETEESVEIFEKYKSIFSYYKLFSSEPSDELTIKMKQMKKKFFKL